MNQTVPLVPATERDALAKALRELVRLHDMPIDEWDAESGPERMNAAVDAARALVSSYSQGLSDG